MSSKTRGRSRAYPEVRPAPESVVPEDVSIPGPNVIGATGGSGTRVVAAILREAGMFIGERRNAYEDALAFGEYSDRWINGFMHSGGRPAPPDQLERMRADLVTLVRGHLADLPPDAQAWGWKEPRSIYLLPFFDAVLPSLRFLHFIRDGRDMAFSENQQQLTKHGPVVVDRSRLPWRKPADSIALWSVVNSLAADYGESQLGERYLRLRFEDLCADPGGTAERIRLFFGLEGELGAVAQGLVRPPATLGRWRAEPARRVVRLHEIAGPALARFGYL